MTDPTCCGEGGSWAPKPGDPIVVGCQLCPKSATYWRTNRADGRPYRPATTEESYGRIAEDRT